jgi:hypothetical protein
MILFLYTGFLTIIKGHAITEISLDVMRYVNTTLYNLLWYASSDLKMAQYKGRNMLS